VVPRSGKKADADEGLHRLLHRQTLVSPGPI